jgi:hypothetical protein
MKNNSFLTHIALAAFTSFGMSIAVWMLFGIFNPVFFWIASTIAAVLGAVVGWAGGRYLATTFAVTMLVRAGILFFALGG